LRVRAITLAPHVRRRCAKLELEVDLDATQPQMTGSIFKSSSRYWSLVTGE
jgi:hypothetical protein